MTVTLPMPPSINTLYATVRGRRVLSEEGRRWKQAAGLMALAAGFRPLTSDVTVEIHFFRQRKAGDVDGRIKATLDCLNRIAYTDDRQVRRLIAQNHDDKDNPRCVVFVEKFFETASKEGGSA